MWVVVASRLGLRDNLLPGWKNAPFASATGQCFGIRSACSWNKIQVAQSTMKKPRTMNFLSSSSAHCLPQALHPSQPPTSSCGFLGRSPPSLPAYTQPFSHPPQWPIKSLCCLSRVRQEVRPCGQWPHYRKRAKGVCVFVCERACAACTHSLSETIDCQQLPQ